MAPPGNTMPSRDRSKTPVRNGNAARSTALARAQPKKAPTAAEGKCLEAFFKDEVKLSKADLHLAMSACKAEDVHTHADLQKLGKWHQLGRLHERIGHNSEVFTRIQDVLHEAHLDLGGLIKIHPEVLMIAAGVALIAFLVLSSSLGGGGAAPVAPFST